MTIPRNLSFLAQGASSTGVLGETYGGTGQSSITTGDLLYGSASNTISKLAIGSTGTILRVVGGVPSWGTDYTGTVTSVAALTLGTTGTDLSSTVANGTTTPVITLNVPTASATNRGVLSSTDWTTFNNKGSGSVTSVAATVPSFLSISGSPITSSGTLAITLSGTALPTANGGTALTSFTANGVLYASSSSVLNTSSGLTFDGTNFATTGNLFVGTTGITGGLNGKVINIFGSGTVRNITQTTGQYAVYNIGSGGTSASPTSAGYWLTDSTANTMYITTSTNTPFLFGTNNTERVRIDTSGNFLIGTTSADPISSQVNGISLGSDSIIRVCADSVPNAAFSRRGSDGSIINFIKNATQVGNISVTSVLTTYNTTSDYRLKNVIASVSNSGTRIDALEPIEYEWNNGGGRTRGFLAHKFAEVYPDSVNGEKDAVDSEDKPIYQSMQASSTEVMADLIAEIQSLRKRIAILEEK